MAARQAGDPGTALLLLNRYLDICEAQEDSAHGSQGGYNDFGMFTGIPRSAALPTAHYVAKAEQEQVRGLLCPALPACMQGGSQKHVRPRAPCDEARS